jgi:hypothetical protein
MIGYEKREVRNCHHFGGPQYTKPATEQCKKFRRKRQHSMSLKSFVIGLADIRKKYADFVKITFCGV